ncbi:putative bifunctional diguanylate cyclase/phosphodiesterase [Syntrophotalea acetylenivorans]|nr:EAL domain-containing protein [Syntrophotalea acetylenivorans]
MIRAKFIGMLFVFGLSLAAVLPVSAANGQQDLDHYRLLVWLVTALLVLVVALFLSILRRGHRSRQALHQEVKRRHKAVSALEESEKRFRETVDLLPQSVFETDRVGKVVFWNRCALDLSGYSAGDLDSGLMLSQLFAVEDGERLQEVFQKVLSGQRLINSQFTVRKKDGSILPALISADAMVLQGQVTGIRGSIVDISDRVQAEKTLRQNEARLNYLAYHDTLTDLPNRALFQDRLEHALARARRFGSQLALLVIDLDRFKNFNDSLGHDVGDQVLWKVACQLRNGLREVDTLARIGGDEFVIVQENVASQADVATVAKKVLSLLVQPISLREHQLFLTASIGISLYPNNGEDVSSLMRQADRAMYQAKNKGGACFSFFSAEDDDLVEERLFLENDLRQAVDRHELLLHYQPQIDLESGRLVGVEALVRWQHGQRGMISPGAFIPLAEETGLIVPIGEWVLRAACIQGRKWQQSGMPPVRVAVNISTWQVRQPDFVDMVEGILDESGFDPQLLELEITESAVMDNVQEAVRILNIFQQRGISLAMDDFGTGYSSLSSLQRLPLSKLKIDRSFIREVTSNANDAALTSSVIALGRTMGLGVVAEGVETEEQLDFLQRMNCAQVQGFLFSKPLPANEVSTLFERSFVSSSAPPPVASEK